MRKTSIRNNRTRRNVRGGFSVPPSESVNTAIKTSWAKLSPKIKIEGFNAKDEDGDTLLLIACKTGRVEDALGLIEEGVNLDATNKNDDTPLIIACKNNLVSVAIKLIEKGADIDAINESEDTPLSIACRNNSKEIIDALMSKDVNVLGGNIKSNMYDYFYSPLYWCCVHGQSDIALEILKRLSYIAKHTIGEFRGSVIVNSAINVRRGDGYTPFFMACKNGLEAVALKLIDMGAMVDIYIEGNPGLTPLIWCCVNRLNEVALAIIDILGNIRMVKKINEKTKDNLTPLLVSCKNGLEDVALELIRKGADINVRTKDGFTPLLYSCMMTNLHNVALELIKKGAYVNVKNENDDTPLLLACKYKMGKVANKLINMGAYVNVRNKTGDTPLLWSCTNRLTTVALELIKKGAYINVKDINGDTPLQIAREKALPEVVDAITIKTDIVKRTPFSSFFRHGGYTRRKRRGLQNTRRT